MNKPISEQEKVSLDGFSSEELIHELSNRSGVTKISVGLYQPYELKRKYHRERLADEDVYVQAKTVLVMQDSNVDQTKSYAQKFWQERSEIVTRCRSEYAIGSLKSMDDKEQKILDMFIELSCKTPTTDDLETIREVSSWDIPLDRIIELIRKCFTDYSPKHPEDRIRTFRYCIAFISAHLSKD
ncbi:hypothetical protein EC604_01665 [Paenibacillus amylolyticus]|uniref:Uncharacterized protein n=1 Tax=Paenibacillus amylolyticus TaxID=1451 RepID=A0A5M9WLW0_PAEAM|nr:hypothetical protein [Paenibacillus amylolyticus]KAA8782554.1 hypothetical protein EC604_01665 [Paenibacillus amylolyticus]